MGVISTDLFNKIVGTSLQGLPDLWNDPAAKGSAWARHALVLAGNGSAIQQKIWAAVDRGIGTAPWQVASLTKLASIDPLALAAGRILIDILPPMRELAKLAFDKLLDLLTMAAEQVLGIAMTFLTAIPVIGQVIEILLAVVMAIVKIVKLAKQQQDANDAEDTVPAMYPSVEADELLTMEIREKCEMHDWTGIFMPRTDPNDPERDWARGFNCHKIEPGGAYANGRLIQPAGSFAYTFTEQDVRGVEGMGGFWGKKAVGAIPGAVRIHRAIQVGHGGKDPVDPGEWLPQSAAAAATAWSAVWSNGPTVFAVDADLALVSWERQCRIFLSDLDDNRRCTSTQLSPPARAIVRKAFIEDVMGLYDSPANSSIEDLISEMPIRGALLGLKARQNSLGRTTTIAYVDARYAPPAIRDVIDSRQKSILESQEVCRLDLNRIPNPLFRSAVELKIKQRGLSCYSANTLQAPLVGPESYDPNAPKPSPPPRAAIPKSGIMPGKTLGIQARTYHLPPPPSEAVPRLPKMRTANSSHGSGRRKKSSAAPLMIGAAAAVLFVTKK